MSLYNPDTEVLFPMRVAPSLSSMHGPGWRALLERVSSPEATPLERCAFELMMVKVCGCANCSADSFRGMRGCTQCARLSVKRSKTASDDEWAAQFAQAQREVEAFLNR